MDARIGIALLALAGVGLNGCAVGAKLGWTANRSAPPSAVIQASCDTAVKTLAGKPGHDTAMNACVEAKTRQGVD